MGLIARSLHCPFTQFGYPIMLQDTEISPLSEDLNQFKNLNPSLGGTLPPVTFVDTQSMATASSSLDIAADSIRSLHRKSLHSW